MLEQLLEVPEDDRESRLEQLRHGPVAPTAAGLVAAFERLGELRVLADGLGPLPVLPYTIRFSTDAGGPFSPRSDRLAAVGTVPACPPRPVRIP
jgi:hypothetical protein